MGLGLSCKKKNPDADNNDNKYKDVKFTISVAPKNSKITGSNNNPIQIKCIKESGEINFGDIKLILINYNSFEFKNPKTSQYESLDQEFKFSALRGGDANSPCNDNGGAQFDLTIKASANTIAVNNAVKLKAKLTNANGSWTFVEEQDILTWEP